MSYSFSAAGRIDVVRHNVRNASEYQHGARLAKSLIAHQLDILEAQGATHVIVSASGHSDGSSHSISVRRDRAAEEQAAKETQGSEFDALVGQMKEKGFLQVTEQGIVNITVPELSAHHPGTTHGDHVLPNGADASPKTGYADREYHYDDAKQAVADDRKAADRVMANPNPRQG